MDCYIVRIYRRMLNEDGGVEEAVGLVERVRNGENRMAFTNYAGLVDLLQDNGEAEAVATDRLSELLPDHHANPYEPD